MGRNENRRRSVGGIQVATRASQERAIGKREDDFRARRSRKNRQRSKGEGIDRKETIESIGARGRVGEVTCAPQSRDADVPDAYRCGCCNYSPSPYSLPL